MYASDSSVACFKWSSLADLQELNSSLINASHVAALLAFIDATFASVYTILVLMTDGDDEQDVSNIIFVAAENLLLSIIIVGVSKRDFNQLQKLDGDGKHITSGRSAVFT